MISRRVFQVNSSLIVYYIINYRPILKNSYLLTALILFQPKYIMKTLRVEEICQLLGGELQGSYDKPITGAEQLERAQS